MSESHRRARLLGEGCRSANRLLKDREALAGSLADARVRRALKDVARPGSPSKTLRKAGIALILAPDPITAVPGIAMLGLSLVARGREPLSSASVAAEARDLLDQLDRLA